MDIGLWLCAIGLYVICYRGICYMLYGCLVELNLLQLLTSNLQLTTSNLQPKTYAHMAYNHITYLLRFFNGFNAG